MDRARAGDAAPAPKLLEVGRILRAHGIRGQVVVELTTNRPERVSPGSTLCGPSGELEVLRSRALPRPGLTTRWLVEFAGVKSREEADRLRGGALKAAPLDVPDALWVHELIGAEVRDGAGALVGVVGCVESNPASDLLVLEDGRLIPLAFVTGRRGDSLTVSPPSGLLEL